MRLMRRLLGFLWTFAAAAPVVAHGGDQAEPSRPGMGAAGGARSESRSTVGQVRIGLGETVLRDLRTPFIPAPGFHLHLVTRIVALGDVRESVSGRRQAGLLPQSRAPPALL
jgi:hypothetical protein